MVTATLDWQGGSRKWAWQGDIDPDSCAKVGSIAIVLSVAGAATLSLNIEAEGLNESNRYAFSVA